MAWGADESISPEAPEYLDGVKAVFVHHTAGSNTYSCADSAAVVRSLYAYHVQSEKWKDIGYNFLVDRCGTVFEGRKGGVDRPVFGAHTYGFNRESAGIAVIGTYTDATAPAAVTTAVARVAAWKLGQYKGDPAGSTMLTAGATGGNYFGTKFTAGTKYSFKQISGHRDGFNTQCPGNMLYGQLKSIRDLAAGPVTGLAVKSVTGAGLSGTTYYTRSAITVGWSASTPSAFVSKYELLVDGRSVATTAGTAASAPTTLAIGTHQVQVRATHQSGKVTTSAAATVVAEQTAPTFTTKPNLALRTGTVNTTAVPLTLKWKATDAASLKEVRLTAPVAKTYGPTTTSASHTAKSGVATTWSMKAYDRAGEHRHRLGRRYAGRRAGELGDEVRYVDDAVLVELPRRQVVLQLVEGCLAELDVHRPFGRPGGVPGDHLRPGVRLCGRGEGVHGGSEVQHHQVPRRAVDEELVVQCQAHRQDRCRRHPGLLDDHHRRHRVPEVARAVGLPPAPLPGAVPYGHPCFERARRRWLDSHGVHTARTHRTQGQPPRPRHHELRPADQ